MFFFFFFEYLCSLFPFFEFLASSKFSDSGFLIQLLFLLQQGLPGSFFLFFFNWSILAHEEIKKRWQEYTELYKKGLNDLDNHDCVVTPLGSN